VEGPVLVLAVEHRDSQHGGFATLVLGNCTGRLPTAPFWKEDLPRLAGIEVGVVAWIAGVIGQFNGRRQVKVSSLTPLPHATVPWHRLLPSVACVAPYWHALDRWRRAIGGPRLRRAVDLFFEDPAFRARFEACPASTGGHHAELGGLLRHTCEVASIGRAIARTCRADHDLVLAGALLHDIGKLEAYRWDGPFDTTEAGALLGHVTLGMLMLDRRLTGQPAACTDRERLLLQHLIASHHGRLEFGAAAPPMTLEAEILHFADNVSAKTASMTEALSNSGNFDREKLVSMRALWQLDKRRVYRGRSDWGAAESTDP
jgi:3'-5' exoribonuclease